MSDPSRNQARTKVVAWSFVAAQFVLIGLMVFGPRDDSFTLVGLAHGLAVAAAIAGVVVGVWSAIYLGRGLTASPLPNGATDLVSAGPYRWARHPMYLAVMLFMASVAARSGSWLVVVECLGLIILFNIKARWEERQLDAAFPGYDRYAASTSRFIPRLPRRATIEG
jgi:protein-S-isoprenylcysteine O-methyltransferase Ste14